MEPRAAHPRSQPDQQTLSQQRESGMEKVIATTTSTLRRPSQHSKIIFRLRPPPTVAFTRTRHGEIHPSAVCESNEQVQRSKRLCRQDGDCPMLGIATFDQRRNASKAAVCSNAAKDRPMARIKNCQRPQPTTRIDAYKIFNQYVLLRVHSKTVWIVNYE